MEPIHNESHLLTRNMTRSRTRLFYSQSKLQRPQNFPVSKHYWTEIINSVAEEDKNNLHLFCVNEMSLLQLLSCEEMAAYIRYIRYIRDLWSNFQKSEWAFLFILFWMIDWMIHGLIKEIISASQNEENRKLFCRCLSGTGQSSQMFTAGNPRLSPPQKCPEPLPDLHHLQREVQYEFVPSLLQ